MVWKFNKNVRISEEKKEQNYLHISSKNSRFFKSTLPTPTGKLLEIAYWNMIFSALLLAKVVKNFTHWLPVSSD